ncbi:MAG TPA: hypothetical protein VE549_07255 [Myxococcaceae bacterium]|jgi:hypothetical protein|nr:hypothetical protein [Myxococcaceae bacterium]
MAVETTGNNPWPKGQHARVPYWVYRDPLLYRLEQERIFQGAVWNYLCLDADLAGTRSLAAQRTPGFRANSASRTPTICLRAGCNPERPF